MADQEAQADEAKAKQKATAPEVLAEGASPATGWQKLWLALLLIGVTAWALDAWFEHFGRVQAVMHKEYTVAWTMPADAMIVGSPSSFRHDAAAGVLRHRGPIDDARKEELLGLLEAADDSDDPAPASVGSYAAALGEMAYASNDPQNSVFEQLLWLGGLSAVLGVLLRSMVNFVGVACFKNQLDLRRYWPWYAMRPVVGILLGIFAIVLVQANLLMPGEVSPAGTVAWLGLAFIAGFGASEFTQRLRLVTQTLFGEGGK